MAGNEYDIVIAGGGIAGLTAGLTAARLGWKTRVLTGPALGGHLLSIERIDGYPSFPEGIPGYELCPAVQEQAAAAGAEFSAAQAAALEPAGGRWRIATSEGDLWGRAAVIATGTALKSLGVPGEERLRGRGVSHCASCDAPLLRGRIAAVVGGGDSALQEALTLAQHASRVIILHRGRAFSAQAAYCRLVREHPKIDVRFGTIVEEVIGDGAVSAVRVRALETDAVDQLEVAGLFVYVGLVPAAAWVGEEVERDASGRIVVDGAMRTRLPGLFAAGTVRSGTAGRAAAAAGDGAAAAVEADRYLRTGAWRT